MDPNLQRAQMIRAVIESPGWKRFVLPMLQARIEGWSTALDDRSDARKSRVPDDYIYGRKSEDAFLIRTGSAGNSRFLNSTDKLMRQLNLTYDVLRDENIEQQAARLVAREQVLDRQDDELRQAQSEWEEERQTYQTEIRRLLGELRRYSAAA